MIKIENLTYVYPTGEDEEEKKALDNVSIEIEKGDFVAILGHNGSGKSTLGKLLNAQIFPSSGDIWVDDLNSKDEDRIWDIREKCSMVFQNPDNQMVATTVEEEVAFGPENLAVPNPELRERVDSAIDLVGMTDYKRRNPSNLSGGQKQRVSIAGVIAMLSDYIIFDEPTAMLDPKGRKDVINLVKDLNKNYGKTIIYITHYMEEAVLADKIVVLDSGKKALEGTAREVFSKVGQMKKLGLAVPQVTEVAFALRNSGIEMDELPLNIEEFLELI
ncbi:Energy-coupling factor transporter ATP-binding protein EcfA1 [Anaerococcus prevotii]|uniref:ABC transporter related n=1 Tax=Anaerococcus prevotii (strain ATCC 9321 / DSM 20548 / JCM 6508 / NCTC 11806 / PC1) TaxID=525919 RepID=C7RE29_ANAPD|nr:energy-coupling factor transporter ATPase [Anaerococcus prevotii]ACV29442.1 ABC transporter related [Anaerococcus prevotii DSM 20548]SUU95114.1 Energy-coupling factor transporter ATP-binding protein EcfA1 [Anaerococcus prevotii]